MRCVKLGKKAKIFHGSSNSTRSFSSDGYELIDASHLCNIIEINTEEHYALVEPNVPLDALVAAALKVGLVPPMVAEFPGITVGGAVQGGSGESSSFKYGLFHDICLEYELVLGDGSLVTTSVSERPDLFNALSCAYGSLGVMTMVKVSLVPATKYVRLKYERVETPDNAVTMIGRRCTEPYDFVDGIVMSPSKSIVMSGTYTDKANLPITRFSRAWDEWFYIHADTITKHTDFYEELIPIEDYLFRYDRGGFWVAKYGYKGFPFTRFTRLLFSGLFRTRTLFKLLQGSNYAHIFLAQDICIPRKSTLSFIEFTDTSYTVYPLWLCPLKPTPLAKLAPTDLATDLVINVGIWGEMSPSDSSFIERNRQLEAEVERLGGRKVLYAHAYYTEDEFWHIYDHDWYMKISKKYHSHAFPDVYAKIITRPPTASPSRRSGLRALFISPYKK